MRAILLLAIVPALVIGAPVSASANPAARLGLASPSPQAAEPASPQGGEPASSRQQLPVPGYKIIAGVILAGIAAALVGLATQDGTPDSN